MPTKQTKKRNTTKQKKVILIQELNWKQIDAFDRKKTIFFLPISPLEEHGPHLPVGTDLLTARDTATEAINLLNKKFPELDYVLLPAIPLGYSQFNTDFPGSFSVSWKVIREIIIGVGTSLANHGFKFMVICTYHMAAGHLKGIYSGMDQLRKKFDMDVCEPWSPYFYSKEIEKQEPKLGFDTTKEIHAGFRETSMMKYQYPYLVDESHKKLQSIYRDLSSPRVIGKRFKELGLKDGYIGSPAKADVDYGRWFFNLTATVYANAALDLYHGKNTLELPSRIKMIIKSPFFR
jgi:creatinine amidohydrolase